MAVCAEMSKYVNLRSGANLSGPTRRHTVWHKYFIRHIYLDAM